MAKKRKKTKKTPIRTKVGDSFIDGKWRPVYRTVGHSVKRNSSWRKSVKHLKKVQKRLGVATGPSLTKRAWKKKTHKPMKKNSGRKPAAKCNPPKMKIAKAGGWIKADAVRFVKKGGRMTVLVRRRKPRRSK